MNVTLGEAPHFEVGEIQFQILINCSASMISRFSCVWLFVTPKSRPMDCSPPGSSDHGILRARILEWVAMPSSRGSCWPRNWTHVSCVSCIAGGLFTAEPPKKPNQLQKEMKSLRRVISLSLASTAISAKWVWQFLPQMCDLIRVQYIKSLTHRRHPESQCSFTDTPLCTPPIQVIQMMAMVNGKERGHGWQN